MSAANLLATSDIILITMYSPTEYSQLQKITYWKNKENNTPRIIEREIT